MDRNQYQSAINRQVRNLPVMIDAQLDSAFNEEKLLSIMSREEFAALKRIVICGAGDSFSCAGLVSAMLPELTGVDFEAWDPMKATRFVTEDRLTLGVAPENMLGLGISAGGGTARVVEWLEKLKACGIKAVALTGKAESRCGTAADTVFLTKLPPIEDPADDIPGLRSYFANILACIAIGCYAGVCNGTLPETALADWAEAIRSYVKSYEPAFDAIDDVVFDFALKTKDIWKWEFIGDGPQYYSAQFCEEKPVETAGCVATHMDSEDWNHINFIFTEPEKCGTMFLVAAGGPSCGRVIETLATSVIVGRPTMVVTDLEDTSAIEAGACIVKLPPCPEGYGWLMPIMDFVPASFLAGYLCTLNGRCYFGAFDTEARAMKPELAATAFAATSTGNSKIEIHK